MLPKGSNANQLMIVELVGPLVDDRGAMARTLATVVSRAGVTLRPGAVEQVAGTAAAWALATLLEGHGRDDLLPRLDELAMEVFSGWRREAAEVQVASSTTPAWERLLLSGASVRVVSALPADIAARLADQAGIAGAQERLIDAADGARGLPRPDAIRDAIVRAGSAPADVMVVGCSPGVLLAAAGARVQEIVFVGLPGPKTESLPFTRSVTTLGEAY